MIGTLEEVLRRLAAKRVGSSWMALCPAHDDRSPSLAIAEKNGKVLLHCHAGCSQASVLAALPLCAPATFKRVSTNAAQGGWRTTARYVYEAPDGTVAYTNVRRERIRNGQGERSFYQLRGNVPGLGDCTRYLYRVTRLRDSDFIFITEGESDANALFEHGFIATTNVCGAYAPWLDSYTDAIRGKHVTLLPDRDEPGRQRVVRIARCLFGSVRSLQVVEVPEGKDIREWFSLGHSELEFVHLVEHSLPPVRWVLNEVEDIDALELHWFLSGRAAA